MAGKNRYGLAVAALTAGFVLVTGGYYLGRSHMDAPYQVSTQRNDPAYTASVSQERPEDGEERPDSLLLGEKIDLNTADVYDLERLPGIGEKRARDIVAYREENGPFRTVDDLVDVPGIGQGILSGLRDYATVGGSGDGSLDDGKDLSGR